MVIQTYKGTKSTLHFIC